MQDEKKFYRIHSEALQRWLCIETEVYIIYSLFMKGAHSHLVSVTFHHIESFESKLQLLLSCFKLAFATDSDEFKNWKKLAKKARELNKKRNCLVHWPIKTGMKEGEEFIEISPSYMDARSLVKNRTSYTGPTITSDYNPSSAKLTETYEIDMRKLQKYKKEFKDFSYEIIEYRKDVSPKIEALLDQKKQNPKD